MQAEQIQRTYETAVEIAARFKVSRRTVLYWVEAGIVPTVFHVGRIVRFDPDAVEEALRTHSRKGGTAA